MTKAGIGVLVGVVIGAGVGGIGGTIASGFVQGMKRAEVRRGWNATTVMIVKRDLAAGELFGIDDVEAHSIAEPFVNDMHVKAADASYVVNQRVRVPMKAGQPLEWALLPLVKNEERAAREACLAAIEAKRGGAR